MELTEVMETNSTRRHGGTEDARRRTLRRTCFKKCEGSVTEGLWPARLRRAGRIAQDGRIQMARSSRSHLYSSVLRDSCRAQRGATGPPCVLRDSVSPCW